MSEYIKEKIIWKKLKDYRCPMPDCGALMKEFRNEKGHNHQCTACDFKLSNAKLAKIIR